MASEIHHVGVAVANLDESIELYRSALGAELVHRAASESEGLEAALLRIGGDEIELMSALRDDSPVGKFMAKRGPGLHHVAYGVKDIDQALAEARSAGLELIDSQPRIVGGPYNYGQPGARHAVFDEAPTSAPAGH